MTLEISRHWFPPEIIREILLKATVKSLVRCKSVCKEWYSLISDQHFIKSHYSLSSTNIINYAHHRLIYNIYERKNNLNSCCLYDVLFDKSVNNATQLENPLQRTRSQWVRIVGSFNGLMCLFVEGDNDDDYNLFIYNPSTRIWNGLPFFRRNSEPDWYSFGYDGSTDDYKIVVIEKSTTKKVNIYSLKTGKWKNLGDFSYQYLWNGCGIFSNGVLHWVAYNDSSEKQRIVSLDLAKETYGKVLQFESDEGYADLSLGVLGECLCGLWYYYESHADLWVMKVYGVKDSWTKLASFSCLTNPWIGLYPRPLFISNDGKVLFDCVPKWVIYNSKDTLSPKIEYISKIFEACIVVESLISPFPL